MKHTGHKSVKEELPKQSKGPKRTEKCWLKVPTHIWENTPGQFHNISGGVAQDIYHKLVSALPSPNTTEAFQNSLVLCEVT